MEIFVGIDVGSTTTKVVAIDVHDRGIVWRGYRRHETRQAETLRDMLHALADETGLAPDRCRGCITGSGGQALADAVGARFVQEVHAVCLAADALHPDAHSVVELGGQDAKVIVFGEQGVNGTRRKIPSMNDRCAGGTGAVIDKIALKLGLPEDVLRPLPYRGVAIHPVAAKCGVFAETDINGLQKLGMRPEELMASLFDAIVLQNLTVLTRGHTLRPRVLLLGGPNTFFQGLREAWQHHIAHLWAERQVALPEGALPDDLITVPPDAQYFAAIGAARYGIEEHVDQRFHGAAGLDRHLREELLRSKTGTSLPGLVANRAEAEAFKARFAPPPFVTPSWAPGSRVRGFIGVDGGSTSTKGVVLSESGDVICTAYRLSQGNPIADTVEILQALRRQVEAQGATLDVLGMGTTGYARTLLRDVFCADVALVETVAHTEAARRFYDDPHVIVDVGGQDIKLIVLRECRIVDFKLNTQCSAGNGYFLQATAESFGVAVQDYADLAFSATAMPAFTYGCAVFLQTDIVNLQRLGWRAPEILAGLANVLPKNVFLYVAKAPNLARLGRRFVLQGATQRNLAVVKAEVDFIRASFAASGGGEPEIAVHRHCGECGAIGAAMEAQRTRQVTGQTTFIGLDAARDVTYETTRNEATRCRWCTNACLRTFIDVRAGAETPARRVVIASCEKGEAEALADMREVKAGLDAVVAANPNLMAMAAREAWTSKRPSIVADPPPARTWSKAERARATLVARRSRVRVGIPRVLHLYSTAPLFSAYLESLGVEPERIVYSDVTTGELYRAGCSRGSIDPCFPSKVSLAHVHNLLWVKHARTPLDVIFFPMFDVLRSPLVNTQGCNGCPTATMTPQTVLAAKTKEQDLFAEHGTAYLCPMVDLSDRRLFAQQMFEAWSPVLGLTRAENERAVAAGFSALETWEASLRRRARIALDTIVRERRLGIVMLGRAYHHDEGVNQGIPEALQKRGYPIFSQNTLPMDPDLLDELFGEEVRAGVITSPLDISDVWKHTSSESTNAKLWAAKFAARHPNLVAIELSSFKCGHDAPVYTVMEEIFACAGTPFFAFRDLDENKATGSIALRVDTIDYFLTRYRHALAASYEVRDAIAREAARHAWWAAPSDDATAGSERMTRVGA